METSEKRQITSKVSGVVYKDLVYYLIPGLLLISGLLWIFDYLPEIDNWISTPTPNENTSNKTVILLFLIPAFSYVVGVIVHSIRLYLDRLFAGSTAMISLGKYLYDKLPPMTNRKKLPLEIRQQAIKSISSDLKKIRLYDEYEDAALDLKIPEKDTSRGIKQIFTRILQVFRKNKTQGIDRQTIELLDNFYQLLMQSLRESKNELSSLIDRWGDIKGFRRNIVVVLLIMEATYIYAYYMKLTTLNISLTAILFLFLFLIFIYKWVLPSYSYANMNSIIRAYLSGNIKVMYKKHNIDNKVKKKKKDRVSKEKNDNKVEEK